MKVERAGDVDVSFKELAILPASKLLIVICLMLLSLSGCFPAQHKEIEKLKWLENVEAEAIFRSDINLKKLRFFSVNGYTVQILGVEETWFDRCYNDVEVTGIEGTTDAPENQEHQRLIELARKFSKRYNTLMQAYLDQQNGNLCNSQRVNFCINPSYAKTEICLRNTLVETNEMLNVQLRGFFVGGWC
jgi:hypothetical protein